MSGANRKYMPDFQKKRFVTAGKLILGLVATALAAFALGVAAPTDEIRPAAASATALVIDDVTVIDVRNGSAVPHQTIVVTGNRITFAGPTGVAPVVDSARRIAGSGKYLIPGLWDSHIHTLSLSPQLHFPLMLANGVTSARDMGDGCSWSANLDCIADSRAWSGRIAAGTLLAPRLVATASYHVEVLGDEDDAREATVIERSSSAVVAALKARGDRLVKLQLDEHVDPVVFQALVRQANAQGMRIAGHLPFSVDLLDSNVGTIDSIEHDTGLLPQCSNGFQTFDGRNRSKAALLAQADERRCDAVLSMLAQRGTAYVPSHVASTGQDWHLLQGGHTRDERVNYVVAPQRWLWRLYARLAVAGTDDEHRPVIAAYHRASQGLTNRAQARGVRVMAGSDSMDPYVTHGFGLHDELEQLVQAGLTPAQALRSATWQPAQHFGLDRDFGTVETGKVADLILLNRNPLEDIRHAKEIDLVVFDGKVYDRKALDGMLAFVRDQAASYSLACKFIWRMIKPW